MLGFAQVIDKAVMESISFDNNTQKVKALGIVSHFYNKPIALFKTLVSKNVLCLSILYFLIVKRNTNVLRRQLLSRDWFSSVLQDETIADKVGALKEADSIALSDCQGRSHE